MLLEEARQPIERNQVDAVVEIDVVCAGDDHQFLRLGRRGESRLAEAARVGVLAADQQNGPGRDFREEVMSGKVMKDSGVVTDYELPELTARAW